MEGNQLINCIYVSSVYSIGPAGDHMTISHADAEYRNRVAAVRGEYVNTAPVRQPPWLE